MRKKLAVISPRHRRLITAENVAKLRAEAKDILASADDTSLAHCDSISRRNDSETWNAAADFLEEK